ncbi:hypothetical protein OCU04_008012 [Sclerotinia nivalis]|uniref:Uncharacterized protein n=1 Tax=Sclerotinia nivalis TaxID=352851 RepID=A0A9X0AHB4_9HELO|nr:hypothetical protein OCU04_008012 [Sclerotinia nivalis]
MALTDCSGNFFAGKRIAVLRNRELALVSPQARASDIICDFNDDSRSHHILRLLDKKNFSADLDLSLIAFFTSMKDAARKCFVEFTHEGRLTWKETDRSGRDDHLFKSYIHISKRLLQAGLRLPKVCDDHGDFIINPILKEKLDLVTSNMITALWRIGDCYRSLSEARMDKATLLQTDTSKVEHFQYVGECILDDGPVQAGPSRTGLDQDSNSSFSEWYEKDLAAEVLPDLDGDFDGESFKQFGNLDIENPTPSDPTTSPNTNCTMSSETSTTLEMDTKELIRPLRHIIIALH